MNITNIVRRKKIINLIINLIVIIFCLINFFFNMNNNLMAITGNYIQIHSLDDININNKFYNIDMQTASKEMYDIESEGIKASMYTIKIDDTNVLVILKENTILTDKTNVEILSEDNIILQLNEKFQHKNYYKYILSNIDFNENIKIQTYKSYGLIIIILLFTFSSMLNVMGIIDPKKSKLYKKLTKENN